ncbi:OsmC family protein [Actinacidiphila glaucinigra]|uniref:OsmC family protein n=1 Tax=Actinacidiphila glaucinigra TaxID=235986 RepID=UPI0029B0CE64|nr:OsmC family protein [Actinacidiphila glaucinigra]MDX2847408.1 OsmC family protein [Streptomyces sp. PA03-3a]
MPDISKRHTYTTEVVWTGNRGTGTSTYRGYGREHEVAAPGLPVPPIPGSSDPAFRGDPARWNPEQLLLAALSQCHMLSYLHVCTVAGVVVTSYTDRAEGTMEETGDGGGHFTRALLRPRVEVASAAMVDAAVELHAEAHRLCFIAGSVAFPVAHEAQVTVAAGG